MGSRWLSTSCEFSQQTIHHRAQPEAQPQTPPEPRPHAGRLHPSQQPSKGIGKASQRSLLWAQPESLFLLQSTGRMLVLSLCPRAVGLKETGTLSGSPLVAPNPVLTGIQRERARLKRRAFLEPGPGLCSPPRALLLADPSSGASGEERARPSASQGLVGIWAHPWM